MNNPLRGGDERLNRRARKAQADAAKQVANDYEGLMRTQAGRRLVWMWLSRAGIYQTTFRTHNGEMAYLEGRRSFGLELVADLTKFTPVEFDLMHKENRPAAGPTQATRHDDPESDTVGGPIS